MNEALGIDWNDKTWWSTEGKAPAKAGNLGERVKGVKRKILTLT